MVVEKALSNLKLKFGHFMKPSTTPPNFGDLKMKTQ